MHTKRHVIRALLLLLLLLHIFRTAQKFVALKQDLRKRHIQKYQIYIYCLPIYNIGIDINVTFLHNLTRPFSHGYYMPLHGTYDIV